MIVTITGILLLSLSVYVFLPMVLSRLWGVGVFRKGRTPGQAALTFDDGPDPVYTPFLLDLLKKHGIKATFFVLGAKAERYPELIARMQKEGHLIGIHNYVHRSNLLMWPWSIWRKQVERSAKIIARITGETPTFYRPPWGLMNVWDYWNKGTFTIVLWSWMGHDWRGKVGRTRLEHLLLNGIGDGTVALLHDAGDTFGADADAPGHMLRSLDRALMHFRTTALQFVRIDEMIQTKAGARSGKMKQWLLPLFMIWERAFVRMFHIRPVDADYPLLQYRIGKYRGRQTLHLQDGQQLLGGDLVVELHLNNEWLHNTASESRNFVQLAIRLIRGMERALPQLAQILSKPENQTVKGLYGISIIHRGAGQLGFTVADVSAASVYGVMGKMYLRFLLFMIHPEGKERLNTKTTLLTPKVIAMSRDELLRRYEKQ